MKRYINFIHKISIFFVSTIATLDASNNANRIFPSLQQPNTYIIKNRSYLNASLFYVNASTAFLRGGKSGGITELYGKYDLKDIIGSLKATNQTADPIKFITNNNNDALQNKSIKFKMDGWIRAHGINVNYEHAFKALSGFHIGASFPFLTLKTINRFAFDRTQSDPLFNKPNLTTLESERQEITVDKIRRETHMEIGFSGNEWNKTGLGDSTVHIRWNKNHDHVMLMRSIELAIKGGVLIPTGIVANNNIPAATSVGTNGHWGLYSDITTEFELKQDLTIGFIFGLTRLLSHKRTIRLSTGEEPTIFSALLAPVEIDPGLTSKISPYLILGNLTDGLDFLIRYTYFRHSKDRWFDKRLNQNIQSFLNKDNVLIKQKENITRWRSHYITLQLNYDTKIAQKTFMLQPSFTLAYDMPMAGNGIAKTHQLNASIQLHF